MAKPKRKLTPAQRKAKRERKREFMTIFVNGKQKRVRRPPTIEGMSVDEFIARNADEIWLHQAGLWELIPIDGETTSRRNWMTTDDDWLVPDETEMLPDEDWFVSDESETMPDESWLESDESETMPDDGWLVSDEIPIMPDDCEMISDDQEMMPDESEMMFESRQDWDDDRSLPF